MLSAPLAQVAISNTPFESVDGIMVKREDLCSPPPGPGFSKIRGVLAHILSRRESVIGVLDTVHSRGGWAVAQVCQSLGKHAVVYYPESRALPGPHESQTAASTLGASLHALQAGRSAILYHAARRHLSTVYPESYLMPNALKLRETVTETEEELVRYTPQELVRGTWVVSVSSGTIAAGMLRGLARLGFSGRVVVHLGYSRPEGAVRRYLSYHGVSLPYDVVDEGFSYRDAVHQPQLDFPCSPYYDRKAWRWIVNNREQLGAVVFWNVG